MKSFFIFPLAILAGVITSSAGVLTPEQALERAKKSDSAKDSRIEAMAVSPRLQLVKTIDANSEPAVYVFAGTSNYLVLSADDAVVPVLGYADRPFDPENIPDNLRYWLDCYAGEIESARRAGILAPSSAPARAAERTFIAPMVTTKWNQSTPFNNDCPEINDVKCVTGCVATALAQVMKYHNYPATGTGSVSYTPSGFSSALELDFSSITFDWNNMLNVYTSDKYSTTEADAVATLMKACGYGVEMNYGTSSSGASNLDVGPALLNYFGYAPGIELIYRDIMDLEAWNAVVYEQLVNYGPVLYTGMNGASGGHAFVCDGYSTDGYFHFNWGWGGMSDGYFVLSALDPSSQGIGGSSSGYNFSQSIVANVATPDEPNAKTEPVYTLNSEGGFTLTNYDEYYFAVGFTNIYNFSATPLTNPTFGLGVIDSEDNVTYLTGSTQNVTLPVASGYSAITVYVEQTLADGTYTVYPVFKCDGQTEWKPIGIFSPNARTARVTIVDGVATPTVVSPEINIAITEHTPMYMGQYYRVRGTISEVNGAEYHGAIRMMGFNSSSQAALPGDYMNVDVAGSATIEFEYISPMNKKFSTYTEGGTYTFYFTSTDANYQSFANYDIVSDSFSATVSTPTTPQFNTVSDFKVNGLTSATDVDPFNLTFTFTVPTLKAGTYAALPFSFYIFNSAGNTVLASYQTPVQFISSSSASSAPAYFTDSTPGLVEVTVPFDQAQSNTTYLAAIFYSGSLMSNVASFTVGEVLGTEDAVSQRSTTGRRYYNLSGAEVRESNPAPGIYIAVTEYDDGTTSTQKVVVR